MGVWGNIEKPGTITSLEGVTDVYSHLSFFGERVLGRQIDLLDIHICNLNPIYSIVKLDLVAHGSLAVPGVDVVCRHFVPPSW
jgi:hypothetical protein